MTTQSKIFTIDDLHIQDKQVTIAIEDIEEPALPFYDVTCSRKKLGQIFTTATTRRLLRKG